MTPRSQCYLSVIVATIFKSRGHAVVISVEREILGAFASYEGHQSHCTKISSSGHVHLWYSAVSQSLGIGEEGRNEVETVSEFLLD